jgi:hypothetical protein
LDTLALAKKHEEEERERDLAREKRAADQMSSFNALLEKRMDQSVLDTRALIAATLTQKKKHRKKKHRKRDTSSEESTSESSESSESSEEEKKPHRRRKSKDGGDKHKKKSSSKKLPKSPSPSPSCPALGTPPLKCSTPISGVFVLPQGSPDVREKSKSAEPALPLLLPKTHSREISTETDACSDATPASPTQIQEADTTIESDDDVDDDVDDNNETLGPEASQGSRNPADMLDSDSPRTDYRTPKKRPGSPTRKNNLITNIV